MKNKRKNLKKQSASNSLYKFLIGREDSGFLESPAKIAGLAAVIIVTVAAGLSLMGGLGGGKDKIPPTASKLSFPPNGFVDNKTTQILNWNPSSDKESGVDNYEVYIDGSLRKLVDNNVTQLEVELSEGSHEWYVKAVDRKGNESKSKTYTITIDTEAPAVPTLKSPKDNLSENSPFWKTSWDWMLSWENLEDGTSVTYQVQVDDSPDFESPKHGNWVENNHYYAYVGEGESWYWKVRARDAAGNLGEWSSVRNFAFHASSRPEVAFETGDVLYAMLTDRFYDNNASNNEIETNEKKEYRPDNLYWYQGGDWEGIIEKLSYLDNLGVDAIMISPPMRNKWVGYDLFQGMRMSSYHGYWAKDYYEPDPHFGTMETLKELVRKAKRRGIATLLEAVPNHSANFLKPANDWQYVGDNRPAPPFDNAELYHCEGNLTTQWNDPYKVRHYDLWGLDDFAHEKRAVENAVNNVYRWWIEETAAAGYRFDAVKHVLWPYIGSFQDAVRVPTFGEAWPSGGWGTGTIARYQENLWGVEDFFLSWAMQDTFADGNTFESIHEALVQDWKYDNPNRLVTFLETLDTKRFLTMCDNNVKRAKLGFTFLLTVRGTPMLYYGTEQGMTGGDDPYNRRMVPSWDRTKPLYQRIQKLSEFRDTYQCLKTGDQIELKWSEDFYAFGRSLGEKENEAIAVFNNSPDKSMTKELDLSPLHFEEGDTLKNVLSGEGEVTVSSGQGIEVSLEPKTAKVFVLE